MTSLVTARSIISVVKTVSSVSSKEHSYSCLKTHEGNPAASPLCLLRSTRRVGGEAWWPNTIRRRSCGRRSRTPGPEPTSRRRSFRVSDDGDSQADGPSRVRAARLRTAPKWVRRCMVRVQARTRSFDSEASRIPLMIEHPCPLYLPTHPNGEGSQPGKGTYSPFAVPSPGCVVPVESIVCAGRPERSASRSPASPPRASCIAFHTLKGEAGMSMCVMP